METEAETLEIRAQPGNTRRHQSWQRQEGPSPGASEGPWPCWHLDFGFWPPELGRSFVTAAPGHW